MQDRRTFLNQSVRGAVAPVIFSSLARGANDRSAYGLIGTGNRGRLLNGIFQKLGAECAALCDVYEPNLERAKQAAPKGVRTYVDYHDLLAQRGLDFVVVATPEHQHLPMLLAGVAAGKDVYQEKPFSHKFEQNKIMIQAVRKSNRIVQIGMQRRSMPYITKARDIVRQGALGTVSQVSASWNMLYKAPLQDAPLDGKLDWERFLGPAPKRPLEPKRFRWWRGFWDYSGGNSTDQGAHLMDVVHSVGGFERPLSAVCSGIVKLAAGAEAPDVFSAALEYPGALVTWSLNYCSAYDSDWRVKFLGDEAAMIVDRRGARVYKNTDLRDAERRGRTAEPVIEEKTDFDVDPHIRNFLDCIRTRKEPNCPVEIAAAAVTGPHLVNAALRRETKVRLNANGEMS
jgi:predicted dehydrogenase